MPRWDDDEECGDEDDFDSPDDDEPTILCPYCGESIYEDSERCPSCERYISQEDAPAAMKPWWILLGAAAGLYAVYRWICG